MRFSGQRGSEDATPHSNSRWYHTMATDTISGVAWPDGRKIESKNDRRQTERGERDRCGRRTNCVVAGRAAETFVCEVEKRADECVGGKMRFDGLSCAEDGERVSGASLRSAAEKVAETFSLHTQRKIIKIKIAN